MDAAVFLTVMKACLRKALSPSSRFNEPDAAKAGLRFIKPPILQMFLQIEALQFSIPVLLILQPDSGPEMNSHRLSGREDFPEVYCVASQEEREAPSRPG